MCSKMVLAIQRCECSDCCHIGALVVACDEAYLYLAAAANAIEEIENELVIDLTLEEEYDDSLRNDLRLAKENLWTLAEDLVDAHLINERAMQKFTTGVEQADACILQAYSSCAKMLIKRYDLLVSKAADVDPGSCREASLLFAAKQILNLSYELTSNLL